MKHQVIWNQLSKAFKRSVWIKCERSNYLKDSGKTFLGVVMVNFICQFACPWVAQMKRCFCVCLWGCFWVRLTPELVDSDKDYPLQCEWVSSNLRGLNRTKSRGRRNLPPLSASSLELEHLLSSSSALGLEFPHQHLWFSGFWTWPESHTGFPQSPACRQQIMVMGANSSL